MTRFLRLWGKKRGHRLTGWWFVGSVGEAAFFAGICLMGILTLTTVLVWQFVSPETQLFRIGFGFWIIILSSVSFIGLGAVGFAYRVLRVATSDERRCSLANQASSRLGNDSQANRSPMPPMTPSLRGFTDSPGVKLAYRLPGNRPEVGPLLLSSLFALAWNALVAILVAVAIGRSGQKWEWPLLIVLPAFIVVGYFAARWFVQLFRRATGIGPTTVEIDCLPMIAGGLYRLYVAQYGRLQLKKLRVVLVCEEQATYHQGTDVRNEHQEVFRQVVMEQGQSNIDFGLPLELECELRLPANVMHSFQSAHNAIQWKVVVEGEANRWPSYCRSFPVVVFPAGRNCENREAAVDSGLPS